MGRQYTMLTDAELEVCLADYMAMTQGRAPMPGYLSTAECIKAAEDMRAELKRRQVDRPGFETSLGCRVFFAPAYDYWPDLTRMVLQMEDGRNAEVLLSPENLIDLVGLVRRVLPQEPVTLDSARERIGARVTYKAHSDAKSEEGVIIRVTDQFVFVRYGASEAAIATSANHLVYG